ncbi:hypothetical protein KAX97_14405 [candidate division WOR-3 bacterium]|nr:hypothetical protein [candidate division WOR-3 bacterium]
MEKLLEDRHLCRSNDIFLTIMYWNKIDKINFYIPYSVMNKMTSPESITRARRKIQSGGNLLPDSPEVIIRRKIKSELVRNYHNKNPQILEKWEKLYKKIEPKNIRRVKWAK